MFNDTSTSTADAVSHKTCSRCGIQKPESEFYKRWDKRRSKRYPTSRCKTCDYEEHKRWVSSTDPAYHKKRFSKKKCASYGITLDEYNALFVIQDGKCAICNRQETKTLRGNVISLAVDHNHNTGTVRGLLCSHCNTLIGLCRENVKVLREAILYLERSKLEDGQPIADPLSESVHQAVGDVNSRTFGPESDDDSG